MRFLFFIGFFLGSFIYVNAQSPALAKNYFEQGEFAKAKAIYQEIYQKNPQNLSVAYSYINTLQELEEYQTAEKIIREQLKLYKNYPNLYVELGYNYQLQQETTKAKNAYQEAIQELEKRPNYAYGVGKAFQKYNLLEEAINAYSIALERSSNISARVELAKIYGEQLKHKKMFDTYIDVVKEQPNYLYVIHRSFAEYITDDKENTENKVLRQLLLERLQEEPLLLYNQLLSWLFIHEKNFKMAFIQEKAIYNREGKTNLQAFFQLSEIAQEQGDLKTSGEILDYIITASPLPYVKIKAEELRLQQQIDIATAKDYPNITKNFEKVFTTYAPDENLFYIKLQHARFLAFKLSQTSQALTQLKQLLTADLSMRKEALLKMLLADILVLDERYNQALIYYSQVQNLYENSPIGHEARYKVAKTSYYKGDFDWAKTQLDVLKTSTSQLIANDALELGLLIKSNTEEDSLQPALKKFAKADLLQFQEKYTDALTLLDTLLNQYKGYKIEDEAFFRKAKIHEHLKNYELAATYYEKIVAFYPEESLADDALFALAKLHQEKLNQTTKAQEYYKRIIFEYPNSLYVNEARKAYRENIPPT
ncbi:tetratricopeptide (TPR) repeat protein [Mesonia hippocampi]|uniref:Tetratricopeptide (TPR) repeat protein n=1 Tax=Mesonia hippocampi TaxID=1628250 RepID=A0A840EJ36_9FLAO|nr:tetratricopeptide repeat protein [Mesonia hippocampi]MBB4118389.1 tetratricopeptide (TPR) repeat protein [Mesonia hippocampi]